MKLRKQIIQLLFLLTGTMSFAQYQVILKANVLDNITHQPIPFVNIEFIDTDVKTVSDKKGQFTLIYNESSISETALFKCSVLGYNTISVKVSDLIKLLKNTDKIYLVPKSYAVTKTSKQSHEKNPSIAHGKIYGTVTNDSIPIQGATVRIKNSYDETHTDIFGNYSIEGNHSDILIVNYLGMASKELLVSDANRIDIELKSDGEVLDEVLLKGQNNREHVIDLGFGTKKSSNALGYSTPTITSKDIQPHHNNLFDILNGRFSGVVVTDRLNPKVYISGRQGSLKYSSAAIFDVDRGIYESFPPIDVQQIETITVLKSLAATNMYGTIGRGGVIIIKTKNSSSKKAKSNNKSALVKGNDYVEETALTNTTITSLANVSPLQKANTFEQAQQIYKTLKSDKDNLSIPFYLDAVDYFLNWNTNYAYNILSNITELAYNSAKALKTIAFKYEALNKLDEAKQIYQRIAVLRPLEAQSYRDLALIYTQTGYYKEAMELYEQMLNDEIKGVDFTGLEQVITSELKHLLVKHGNKTNFSKDSTGYLQANFKYDIRIVFDWNDPNVEFEVQFVNPKKKFFKWSQTLLDNQEMMLDGIAKGYYSEEFVIDEDEAGEWIINIESLSEESQLNPAFLKYTVFRNYGLSNETKQVKIIEFSKLQHKVTLDKLMYNL